MQVSLKAEFKALLLGAPGAGNSCVEGVTREPSFFKGPALGIQGNAIINVLDMPGLCDLSLPLAQMINQIETILGSTEFEQFQQQQSKAIIEHLCRK